MSEMLTVSQGNRYQGTLALTANLFVKPQRRVTKPQVMTNGNSQAALHR
jgi:hypothetical protein